MAYLILKLGKRVAKLKVEPEPMSDLITDIGSIADKSVAFA